MKQNDLMVLWPEEKNISECIRQEAENKSPWEFLAVHCPVTFLNEGRERDEQEFFQSFLTEQLDSGRILFAVIGDSGVGKSHMVRWLEAQLVRREDAPTKHIIRVPKSVSLRRVIQIILEGQEGPEYEELYRKLDEAGEFKNPNEFVKLLAAQFSFETEAYAEVGGEKGSLAKAFHLFNDPVTQKALIGTKQKPSVLMRLAQRATGQKNEGQLQERVGFEASDFEFNDIERGDLSEPTRMPFHKLQTKESQRTNFASFLNNDILDRVLAKTIPTTKLSFRDLFRAVRKRLLEEGRELILLVEDFATMAGLQEELLTMFLDDTFRDNRQELCTLRVALAVTEGYLENRETLRTRINKNVWRITQTQQRTQEEIEEQAIRFVAQYLNAARLGQENLKKSYEERKGSELTNWIPIYQAASEIDYVDDFGSIKLNDDDSIPLFPYNRSAIIQQLHQHCTEQDSLVFNPRKIINFLLLELLKNYREDILQKNFPSSKMTYFQEVDMPRQLTKVLSQTTIPEKDKERIGPLLRYWGNNPLSLEEATLSGGILRAFDFSEDVISLFETTRSQEVLVQIPFTPKQVESSNLEKHKAKEEQEDWAIKSWRENWETTLSNWEQGGTLAQNAANKLRKWLSSSILRQIHQENWPLHITSDLLKPEYIFIPQARGQGKEKEDDLPVHLCSDTFFKENTRDVAVLVEAISRVHEIGMSKEGTLDYPGSEDDYALYQSWLTTQTEKFLKKLLEERTKEELCLERIILPALHLSAIILGDESSTSINPLESWESLWYLPKEPPKAKGNESWDQLTQTALMLHQEKNGLQFWLRKKYAVFQGTGSKVKALHAEKLFDAFKVWLKQKEFDTKLAGSVGPQIQGGIGFLLNLEHQIRGLFKELKDWTGEVEEDMGEKWDKKNFLANAQKALNAATVKGLQNFGKNRSSQSLDKLLVQLEKIALVQTLQEAQRIVKLSTKDTFQLLDLLSKIEWKNINIYNEAIYDLKQFLAATRRYIENQIKSVNSDIFVTTLRKMATQLKQLGDWFAEQSPELLEWNWNIFPEEMQGETELFSLSESTENSTLEQKCIELNKYIGQYEQVTKLRQEAKELSSVQSIFEKKNQSLEEILLQQKILDTVEAGYLDGEKEKIEKVRLALKKIWIVLADSFIKNPFMSLDRESYSNMFENFSTLLSDWSMYQNKAWLRYFNGQEINLPNGLSYLEAIEQLKASVKSLKEKHKSLQSWSKKVPKSFEQLEEFEKQVSELKAELLNLDLDNHPDVRLFIGSSQKETGASLELLTEIVLLWLRRTGKLSSFVVRYKEDEDL